MDQLVELAKEMGYTIQQDERFIRTQMAQAAADEDEALQSLIGEFNLKRMAISNEMGKDEKDEEKLNALDTDIRAVYERIMSNEHMTAYNAAKSELDAVLNQVNTILMMAAQGQASSSSTTSATMPCTLSSRNSRKLTSGMNNIRIRMMRYISRLPSSFSGLLPAISIPVIIIESGVFMLPTSCSGWRISSGTLTRHRYRVRPSRTDQSTGVVRMLCSTSPGRTFPLTIA